jgi:FkbM family methyltransferase
MKPIETLVPNNPAIELVAYYEKFLDYYPECELQTKRWFVDHVGQDWVMFDAGANIGYYSILFSRLAMRGRIYAFEPTETIDLLRANLAHNACTNVTPLEIALGSASGAREDSVFRIWGEEPERRLFEFATVDDMVARLKPDRLDCIKIDVDSFDFDVLRGAESTLRRLDPWIVVELNHGLLKRNQSVREALEWLYSLGYRNAHITDDENYILRRRENTAGNGSQFPAMLISFETQPIVLPPKLRKGSVLLDAFETEPARHNAASVAMEGTDGFAQFTTVSVPGPQWSYAASWSRSGNKVFTGPIVVEIDAAVSGATVGFGCTGVDGTAYVGREALAKPLGVPQTLTILIDRGSEVGNLVIRNADPNGASGTVRVRSIHAYVAEVASPHASANLLSSTKRRISIEECSAALAEGEMSADSSSSAIEIVPVAELGVVLGFHAAFVPDIRVYRHALADFRTEVDEAAMFRYLYGQFQPRRHLEINSRDDWGASLCASASDAEIWTDAPTCDGATNPPGYHADNFSSRIHQVPRGSEGFHAESFGRGFFDTVLINGSRSFEDMTNDTNKALYLLRDGGLVIWEGFCADAETLAINDLPRYVVSAVIKNFSAWRPLLSKWFWIRPSWILVGVKE